jgi:DNA-binding transcriptional LysR family regulator
MREVKLTNIDLNLLVILLELLKTKHMTQASKNLNMSQSAVSRAFGRLKSTFNDPLLIRTPDGYKLSHKANSILPELINIISGIQNIIDEPEFDPKTAIGTVKFFGVDLEIISYLPNLFAKIQEKAPGVQLSVLTGTQNHFELLQKGDVHFSMSGMKTNQALLKKTILSEEKAVCVMRKGHPLENENLTLKKYLTCKHGIINLTGEGLGPVDKKLQALGHKREITIRLPNFTSAAYFCEESDILFLMPENIAKEITQRHELVIKDPPKELKRSKSRFFLYWHESNHNNPLCMWIRQQMK